MRNRDIQQIRDDIEELANVKESLDDAVNKFLNDLRSIEKDLEREFSASHILNVIRTTLESIDTDSLFDFVDDLEAEVSGLSYKYKRVIEANKIAIHPRGLSPSFYKPVVRPNFTKGANNENRPEFG